MSQSSKVTGAPYITLVDVDGYGVPDAERYSPTCPPDPFEETDATMWSLWTDVYRYELGPDDDPTGEFPAVVPAPDPGDAADSEAAYLRRLDRRLRELKSTPIREASAGRVLMVLMALGLSFALPGVILGARGDEPRPTLEEVYHPTEEDWKSYAEWSRELDARRDALEEAEAQRDWYERNTLADFNRERQDWTEETD